MGISGNASFCQVVNHLLSLELQLDTEIVIHVFENKEEHFATGAAYSIFAPDIWTLNNPAKDFKFIQDKDTNPLNVWIADNLASLRIIFEDMNEEYCPRAVVGYYLKAQYARHKSKAQSHGIKVVEHFEEVLSFDSLEANRWEVKTAKQQIESDFLFLCFGHVQAHHYPHLESKPGYYTVSTPLSALEELPKKVPIYILGGQASFVDYAIWLKVTKKHQGALTSLTRNPSIITSKGNLDTCDMAPLEELKQSFNCQKQRLSFSAARDSFWKAYQQAAKDPVLTPPSTSMALSYQLAKYEKRAVPPEFKSCGNIDELRAFIKSFYFNGAYEAFWTALTEEGKESFNRLMYTQIMAYLTGITPVNTRLLLKLYNEGDVIEKSGLTRVDYDEKSQEFLLYFASGEIEKAKYLLDTSGYSYNIGHCNMDCPLAQNAVAKGLLVPKHHGGIEINNSCQPKNRNGKVQQNLFCIGPVASFAEKYPTPHASFLVFNASEKAAKRLNHELLIQLGFSPASKTLLSA